MFSVGHLQPPYICLYSSTWLFFNLWQILIPQMNIWLTKVPFRFTNRECGFVPRLLIESLVSLTRWEVLNPDRWRQEVKTGSDQEPTIGGIVEAGLEMEQYCPCLTDRSPQPEIAEGTTYELKQCMLCYCNAQLYNCAKKSITLINTLSYPAAQIRSHWLL